VTVAALAGNFLGIILRWIESYQLGIGHAPLSNLYESLIFFAATIALIYLVVERKYGSRIIGAFTAPLAFTAMAYASLSPNISDRIQPLIPALKSNWLIAHVVTCFIGYAAFAIAFGVSIMFLIKSRSPVDQEGLFGNLPAVNILDDLTHQLVMFGFLFLTAGIISGAVWANSAWGRYWGWDPKETWSLITWFVYAILLHARLMRGWRGKRIAVLSITGFGAVLFTYFGVNLLPGLHSYGSF
jgi:cytochrome c-type biogenesis protein CcsB